MRTRSARVGSRGRDPASPGLSPPAETQPSARFERISSARSQRYDDSWGRSDDERPTAIGSSPPGTSMPSLSILSLRTRRVIPSAFAVRVWFQWWLSRASRRISVSKRVTVSSKLALSLSPLLAQRLRLTRATDRDREVARVDRVPVAEREPVLDRVLELAHVAGPAVALERAERRGREPLRRRLGPSGPRRAIRMGPREEGLGEQPDVLAPLAQGRQRHRDDARRGSRDPRGSRPAATSCARSRLVAATIRTSTDVGCARADALEASRSWSARSSFTWTAGSSSPISSRKSVPPCADSKRPMRRSVAPVKAPFS